MILPNKLHACIKIKKTKSKQLIQNSIQIIPLIN